MTTIRIAQAAKQASRACALLSEENRRNILCAMADALQAHKAEILAANAQDMERAKSAGKGSQFLDRLKLDASRVDSMAQGVRDVAKLPDPLGGMRDAVTRPNGLTIMKKPVPLGVIAIIYEARPNVTADSIALCVMSGNAVILRGGSEAIASNGAICRVMVDAANALGMPQGAIALVEDTDRASASELMHMNGLIDVLIPRGGKGLIQSVVREATVPVIETGAGVCHVYVDEAADFAMATQIILNAKCSRPSVCNAAETMLVHSAVAKAFLPDCIAALQAAGVEVRGCDRVREVLPSLIPATDDDWSTEYGELILSVKVVDSLDEAVEHITCYGTGHSECIVTQNLATAQDFMKKVDAAAVYVNASTRFTDGNEFGFGAEIGISTQKLHARGPMGLFALTSYKYIVIGSGQVR